MVNSDETHAVSEAMQKYGGGFVKSLGAALTHADPINQAKIKTHFNKYWEEYKKIAKDVEAQEQERAKKPDKPEKTKQEKKATQKHGKTPQASIYPNKGAGFSAPQTDRAIARAFFNRRKR